jgi:hypothetical protein
MKYDDDSVSRNRTTKGRGASVILDGAQLLQRLLERAGYPSVAHAVAEHAVFLHPDTVAQTKGEPVFPIVRSAFYTPRAQVVELPDGRRVWADDNGPPTWAFLWAARRKKGPDVQFNHVWTGGDAPKVYTALWNLCATPAFLAKTTDTRPEVKALLRYHAYVLYRWLPTGEPEPAEPQGYSDLRWAPMPDAVPDLEAVYRLAMSSSPKNRATCAARQLGWLFSGWQPDASL